MLEDLKYFIFPIVGTLIFIYTFLIRKGKTSKTEKIILCMIVVLAGAIQMFII